MFDCRSFIRTTSFLGLAALVLLPQPTPVDAQAANGGTKKMEYWLGAIPPVVQRDRKKAIPSDYMELFSAPNKYPAFGARMTAFEIPTQLIMRGTTPEQQGVLNGLRDRHIKLAGQLGVMLQSPNPACGGGGEGRLMGPNEAAGIAKRLHDIGGQLDYLDMDEPVTFGHFSPQNKCPEPIPQLADNVASHIADYQRVFPAMKVNLIDAVGSRAPTLVADEVSFVDLLAKKGIRPEYFIADVQWDDPNWQPVFEQLATKLHERGVKVGLFCDGSLSAKSDLQWDQMSVAHCKAAGQDPRISPDLFVIGSWSDFPTHVLPEDQPGTLTHIGKELMSQFP